MLLDFILLGLAFQIMGAGLLFSTSQLFVRPRNRFRLERSRGKAKFALRARIGIWLVVTGSATQLVALVRVFGFT